MTQPLKEPLEFVFLWWSDSDHGVILSRGYHTLVDRFHFAQQTARTWGEFLRELDDGADYLEDFMQFDEVEPRDRDRLEDLRGSIWVLDNDEFPLTQCAQESFQFYGHHFPECAGTVKIRTEYDMPLLLYPKSAYFALKIHLMKAGHRVTEVMAAFPMNIYPY
jgi:hypothetical protein